MRLVIPALRAPVLLCVALVACKSPPPDVLLVTLDTTRVDHLSPYGYERDTSPNLSRLAADGVAYTRAYSVASWTLPSHASLFTGKYPSSHGASHDPEGALVLGAGVEGVSDEEREKYQIFRARGMGRDERTLAELLGGAGYRSAGVVGGPWLKRVFGLSRGFEHWDEDDITGAGGRRANDVSDRAIAWLDALPADVPFLLFLNFFDAHMPYQPPRWLLRGYLDDPVAARGSDRDAELRRASYDAEILYADMNFGRVIDRLKSRGRYDETLILVTADHGELLGEHSLYGHPARLYEELTRIPLIVKFPKSREAGVRIDEPIQLVDLFALILDQAGIEIPPDIQGQLPGHITHPILTEESPAFAGDEALRAYYDGSEKFLWGSRGTRQLYDLANDPKEQRDLAGERPARVAEFETALQRHLATLPAPSAFEAEGAVDRETREALRALGYAE
jgi:arylsulfatase A-like enzyme